VPELVGKLYLPQIGEIVLDYLQNPEKLRCIQEQMKNVSGKAGTDQKITNLAME